MTGFILFVLLIVVAGESVQEETLKVIIGASENVVHPRPGVKPTQASFSHEPGVPPQTVTPPRSTSRPSNNNNNPFNWFNNIFNHRHRSYQNETDDQHSYQNDTDDHLINQSEFDDHHRSNQNETDDKEIGSTENLDYLHFNDSVEFITNHSFIGEEVPAAPLFLLPQNNLSYQGSDGNSEPNKGVVEWVLGLVGLQNNNNQNVNRPTKPEEPLKTCGQCQCGVSFTHTRIVGGVVTQVNAYPWMTLLTYNGRFYCGASIINNKYLLTATHCVNGFNKERLQATFLDHDRASQTETKTFTRKIAAILKHKGYNQGGSYNNDISLLRLDQELSFTGLVRPVCLPKIGKSYTGYSGIVTGWGATEEHGSVSNKLREVEVPIISNMDCRNTGYGNKITDNMLCAGYKTGKKDSCQGDSGGPLHVVNKTFHSIIGIVSWGEGCAEPNYPGVYTRVNRYVSWIKSNTKDACYCT